MQSTLVGESQESPTTPISAPPKLLLPPFEQDSQWDAGRQPSPQEDGVLSQPTTVQSDSKEDDFSLGELLQGTQNVLYEAKDDVPGVHFDKNGQKKWLPVIVTDDGKELSVKDLEKCKRIVYFEAENGPHFSMKMSVPNTNC